DAVKSSASAAREKSAAGRSETPMPACCQPTWKRTTRFAPLTGTHTSPNAAAAGNGFGPTLKVATTRFVRWSIRLTVPSKLFGTKTLPSLPNAALLGPSPTFTRATTRSVLGFSRTAYWSPLEVIQIEELETAIESGWKSPTGTARALFV